MEKIFLDTCIWIRFIWQSYFSEKPKKKRNSTKLIETLKGDKRYQILLSPFLITEISSHLRDWFILQKVIKDGFSFSEFKQEKKNYQITEQEREKINDVIIKIGKIENVNVLVTKSLKAKDIEEIIKLESEYYFDFYDAIHVFTALENRCKYFVTTDRPLRKNTALLIKNTSYKIDSLPPKSLLKIVS